MTQRSTQSRLLAWRVGLVLAGALAAIPTVILAAGEAHAAFPGSNGRIAFVSDRDGHDEIYSMNADGTGQTRLTTTGGDFPSFSADGALIAYFNRSTNGISIMNADGSGRRELTDQSNVDGVTDVSPAFAPDGSKVVFVSNRGGSYDLYVIGTDGSDVRRLTTSSEVEQEPSFSPDGSRIVFGDGAGAGIRTVDANGGGRKALANGGGDPAYSPDGASIVFNREAGDTGTYDIYVMNADGTGQRALTSSSQFSDVEPAFSPDGKQIVLAGVGNTERGGTDIYMMNADGTGHHRVVSTPGYEWNPDWQPAAGETGTPPAPPPSSPPPSSSPPPPPPPPSPSPRADTAAPQLREALRLLAAVLTMDRRGFASALVGCPDNEVSCRIVVDFLAPSARPRGARPAAARMVRIGRGRATVPGGKRAKVRVKLSPRGIRAVRRARRRGLRIRVAVAITDQAGNRAAARRVARLRAPRRR